MMMHIWMMSTIVQATATHNSDKPDEFSATSTPPSALSSSSSSSSSSPLSSLPFSSPILFLSLSLRGHLVPLTRLASELSSRGFSRLSFAVQEDGRDDVNKTRGAKFISLGRLPYAKAERREKLKQICQDSSFFRGFLTLINDIYLPNSAGMYKQLHQIVARERPALIIMDAACKTPMNIHA